MSLGLRIRQLRQSRGLTQQQLGSPDLSKSFISLVERDRTRPSVATLAFLARRLGTSVDALLGQEGHMPETAAASLLALSDDATRKRDVATAAKLRSEEHTSELQSRLHLVCRLLLEKKKLAY